MEITHNQLNLAISEMEKIVAKGQPFAKRNKDRRIRAILQEMHSEQGKPPSFGEIWFYFRMWFLCKFHLRRG